MDVNEIKYTNNSFTAYTQNKQSEVIELDIRSVFCFTDLSYSGILIILW